MTDTEPNEKESAKQSRLKKPSYKRMAQVLNARLKQNLVSSALAIFFFNIMISFLLTTGTLPAMILSGRFAVLGYALSCVLSFFMLVLIFTAAYGVIMRFTSCALGKKYIISITEKNNRVLKSSALFSAVFVVSCVASALITILIFSATDSTAASKIIVSFFPQEIAETAAVMATTLLFAGVAAIVVVPVFELCFLPFVFVWNAFIDDKNLLLSNALKKSFFIIKGRYFHYIGFVIYACTKNALILLSASFLHFFTLAFASQSFRGVFSFVTGLLAFVQYYVVLAKVYYCIPVYYYSFLSENGMIAQNGNVARSVSPTSPPRPIAIETQEENPDAQKAESESE